MKWIQNIPELQLYNHWSNEYKTTAVIVPIAKNAIPKDVPAPLTDMLEKALKTEKGFSGNIGDMLNIPHEHKEWIFIGAGTDDEVNGAAQRHELAKVASSCVKSGHDSIAYIHQEQWCNEEAFMGIILGSYRVLSFKSPKEKSSKALECIYFVGLGDIAEGPLENMAKGVYLARDLGNCPSNILTPEVLGNVADNLATTYGFESSILNLAQIKDLKMDGIVSVAQGSVNEPRLICLRYSCGKADAPTIGLVGKGLTFDAGGISIKPGAGMDEMKFDMCGGAAVLGTMKTIGEAKPQVNVVAVVPASENLLGAAAYKPGDILTSYDGQTVEILNTDAEGRLILMDALTYIQKEYKPDVLIDLATLTGACVVALGHHYTAGMALEKGQELLGSLIESGKKTGDDVWPLPMTKTHQDHMKSEIADLKNISAANVLAGSSTAGAFLSYFVDKDLPWVHLDIAGSAWWTKAHDCHPAGATGAGVRILSNYIMGLNN